MPHERLHLSDVKPLFEQARREGAPEVVWAGDDLQALAPLGARLRALMAKPRFLMLDEPSLGLAPLMVQEIFRVIGNLREKGVTILLVEQNVHLALSFSDYAYVIAEGRPFMQGAAQEIAGKPEIKEAYLGL